jgi:hypothetical protein
LKRWHLTLVLSVLAAAGVALAGGVAAVEAAPVQIPIVLPAPLGVAPVVAPVEVAPRPMQTTPGRQPATTIPELEERLPPPVALPPDPIPLHPVPTHSDPCPACGMG